MAIPIPICNYSNQSKISVIKSPSIPLLSSSNKISIPFSSPLLIDNHELPPHWQLLPSQDLQDYLLLKRQFFEKYGVKSKKGKRLDGCNDMLSEIRRYIEKSENNKWKRSIVCGVIFLQNSLAINIQQLRILIGKCKSSINGSLKKCGFDNCIKKAEGCNKLIEAIPFLRDNPSERRKWTLRQYQQKGMKIIQNDAESDFSYDSDQNDSHKSETDDDDMKQLTVNKSPLKLDSSLNFNVIDSNNENNEHITEPEVAPYTEDEIKQMCTTTGNNLSIDDDYLLNSFELNIMPVNLAFDL